MAKMSKMDKKLPKTKQAFIDAGVQGSNKYISVMNNNRDVMVRVPQKQSRIIHVSDFGGSLNKALNHAVILRDSLVETKNKWDKLTQIGLQEMIEETGAAVSKRQLFLTSSGKEIVIYIQKPVRMEFTIPLDWTSGNKKEWLYVAAAVRNHMVSTKLPPDKKLINDMKLWAKTADKKLEAKSDIKRDISEIALDIKKKTHLKKDMLLEVKSMGIEDTMKYISFNNGGQSVRLRIVPNKKNGLLEIQDVAFNFKDYQSRKDLFLDAIKVRDEILTTPKTTHTSISSNNGKVSVRKWSSSRKQLLTEAKSMGIKDNMKYIRLTPKDTGLNICIQPTSLNNLSKNSWEYVPFSKHSSRKEAFLEVLKVRDKLVKEVSIKNQVNQEKPGLLSKIKSWFSK